MNKLVKKTAAVSLLSFILLGAHGSCPDNGGIEQENANLEIDEPNLGEVHQDGPNSQENPDSVVQNDGNDNNGNRLSENQRFSRNYATVSEKASIVCPATSPSVSRSNVGWVVIYALVGVLGCDMGVMNFPARSLSYENERGKCFAFLPKPKNMDPETKYGYLTVRLDKKIAVNRIAIVHPLAVGRSAPKDVNIYRFESEPSGIDDDKSRTQIGKCNLDFEKGEETQDCHLFDDIPPSQIIQFEFVSKNIEQYICVYQVIIEG